MEQVCRHDYRSTSCLQHPCHLSPNHANACSCPVMPPLFNNMMLKFFPLHVIQATLTELLFIASLLSTTHSWDKNCPHYFWRTCERAHLVHCCHCYVHAGHAGYRLLELPPDKPIRRLHAGWPRLNPMVRGTIRPEHRTCRGGCSWGLPGALFVSRLFRAIG